MLSDFDFLFHWSANLNSNLDYIVLTKIFSILFWTEEQKKLIDSISANESIVLLGDYGTGKTVVIQSVAEKLRNSDRDLVYINALDTKDKTWEDVLDVINKLRFGAGVTVLDMGTLRRQYLKKNEGTYSNKLNFFFRILYRKIISVRDNTSVSTPKSVDDYISNLKKSLKKNEGIYRNKLIFFFRFDFRS